MNSARLFFVESKHTILTVSYNNTHYKKEKGASCGKPLLYSNGTRKRKRSVGRLSGIPARKTEAQRRAALPLTEPENGSAASGGFLAYRLGKQKRCDGRLSCLRNQKTEALRRAALPLTESVNWSPVSHGFLTSRAHAAPHVTGNAGFPAP